MSLRAVPLVILSLSSAFTATCTPLPTDGTSPVRLVIASLDGTPGRDEAGRGSTFQSDVWTSGQVVEDEGRVSFLLVLKDPGAPDLPAVPSPVNLVTVMRYRIRFLRADGRRAEGVDVPYSFDGAMTLTVGADGASGQFVVVRAQAKLEPPLVSLRDRGGAIVVSTMAEVTFFGRDQAGHEVSAVGLVGVNFADWTDD